MDTCNQSSPMGVTTKLLLLAGLLLGSIGTGCGDGATERLNGPVSSFKIRRFKGPDQPIAQSLDPGGRALVFLELTDAQDGVENEIDPAWTFEITVQGPNGQGIALLEDPVLPTAWADDPGARFLGGFMAPVRGSYQIEVRSPNCPSRSAPLVLLPIN